MRPRLTEPPFCGGERKSVGRIYPNTSKQIVVKSAKCFSIGIYTQVKESYV